MRGMSQGTAIVIAALIFAATALFLFRYELVAGGVTFPARLDRWTGSVVICATDARNQEKTCP